MLATQCLTHSRHSHVHVFDLFVHSFKKPSCSRETISKKNPSSLIIDMTLPNLKYARGQVYMRGGT